MKHLPALIATALVLNIADCTVADQYSSCDQNSGYVQLQPAPYDLPVVMSQFPQIVQQPVAMQWYFTPPVATPYFETQQQTCQSEVVFADARPMDGMATSAPVQNAGMILPAAYDTGLQQVEFMDSQATNLTPTDEPPVLPGVDTE